jgi:hypothetical protein
MMSGASPTVDRWPGISQCALIILIILSSTIASFGSETLGKWTVVHTFTDGGKECIAKYRDNDDIIITSQSFGIGTHKTPNTIELTFDNVKSSPRDIPSDQRLVHVVNLTDDEITRATNAKQMTYSIVGPGSIETGEVDLSQIDKVIARIRDKKCTE